MGWFRNWLYGGDLNANPASAVVEECDMTPTRGWIGALCDWFKGWSFVPYDDDDDDNRFLYNKYNKCTVPMRGDYCHPNYWLYHRD